MSREQVHTRPDPYQPYLLSQGIGAGELVFVSGQAGYDDDGRIVPGGFVAQLDRAFFNLARALEAGGSSLGDVLKVTIYVTDMARFADVVEARRRHFTAPYPADTIVEVSGLYDRAAQVEIDAVATRRSVRALSAPGVAVPPVAALSSGLVQGGVVYVTGQLAYDERHQGVPPGLDAKAQTELVIRRLEALLRAEGLGAKDVIKATLFVTDPADVMPVNDVYARWVSEPVPARSTVGVAFLALPGARVEIELLARRG